MVDRWEAKNLLKKSIADCIAQHGPQCSLNHLDVSEIEDMGALFENNSFNGDISQWDVSRVVDMENMFNGSSFNGDISRWDVSNVTNMYGMFKTSFFNGDISSWNTSRVTCMGNMFMMAAFNGDISGWNVANVREMYNMFEGTVFSGNLSQWDMHRVEDVQSMFIHSSFNGDVSGWCLNDETVLTNLFKNCPFQGDFPRKASPRRVAGGALSPDYRGRFNNQYSLYEAERFFGSEQALVHYLRDTASKPLDRIHFEKLVGLKRRPDWAAKDVFQWVKRQQPVLAGLGMDESEMGLWLQENFTARTADIAVYPLDGLGL